MENSKQYPYLHLEASLVTQNTGFRFTTTDYYQVTNVTIHNYSKYALHF